MSEEKKAPRTLADVQQEYQQAAMRAGDLHYRLDAFSKDLELITSNMRDLNIEAAQLKQAADEAAKKQAEGEKPNG